MSLMNELDNKSMIDEAVQAAGVEVDEAKATEVVPVANGSNKPEKDSVEALTDELMKASRLLRQRRRALRDESREAKERAAGRLRALKLLALKPGMEQSELAELMGERLRMVDEATTELEGQGLLTRAATEDEDMRAVTLELTEAGTAAIQAGELSVDVPLLAPDFSDDDLSQLTGQLAKLNASFEALGLRDEERGPRDDRRGGRDDRSGFRGGRDDRSGFRGGRGNKGDYRAPGHDGTRHTQSAHYEPGDRRERGGRSRKGFGSRNGRGQGSSN